MKCAWENLLAVLPMWLRPEVDRLGRKELQELRLRLNAPPQMITTGKVITLERTVSLEDLKFCINVASRYSPWSAETISHGYVTAQGGHRIGICGQTAIQNNHILTFQSVTSLCIRVARDFSGISGDLYTYDKSILIIGKPSSGKTTLLRDLIRQKSNRNDGAIAVVDERSEIFPFANGQLLFPVGKQTDVLIGAGKREGIESLIRNMSPHYIAVDEITSETDCEALLKAGWCGVSLIATAHAGNLEDFAVRSVYRHLRERNLFQTVLVLDRDNTFTVERMNV